MEKIAELVKKTHLTYATGETGYYRSCTVFCREAYTAGAFGRFVYGESQYNHDMRNMFYAYKYSGGENWKQFAGFPPTYYPTHSVSMILGSMPGTRITKVSAMGYVQDKLPEIFGINGQNLWNNPFSNTVMLARISNGGIARISENRCVGWKSPESYISQFYGDEGAYEFSVAKHYFSRWDKNRTGDTEDHISQRRNYVVMRDITDIMIPTEVLERQNDDYASYLQWIADGAGFTETSKIQPTERLPHFYNGLPNAHNGCHHFMVDDFCKAAYLEKLAPTNIWSAARFNIPGLIAHESAMHGGVLMDVPNLGEPPADWEMLNPDGKYGGHYAAIIAPFEEKQ